MTFTIELNEQDITEAISHWLRETRGMKVKGAISISHTPGDQRDPPYTTIEVSVEPSAEPKASPR